MTTVGVFGGSFNPPHLAHGMVCMAALEMGAVDVVLFVPTFRHAFAKELAPFEHRVAMCRLVAQFFEDGSDVNRVEVSRIESDSESEVSRTYETLERLQRDSSQTDFRLIIGSDILAETDKWYRWDDVARMAPPLVFGREGCSPGDTELVVPNISSTAIRAAIAAGESVEGLVSRSVLDYIAARSLYR